MQKMEVTQLSGTLGGRVENFDLAAISDEDFAQVANALWEYQVLVFPQQNLAIEDHVALGKRFGPLHTHPAAAGVDGHPEILLLKNRGKDKNITQTWHSDVSCETVPPIASLLYITQVPENGGGDTMFADMAAAYAELSEPLKQMLDGKMAFHDGEIDLRNYGFRLKPGQTYPTATHPVVIRHPETTLPVLFVN